MSITRIISACCPVLCLAFLCLLAASPVCLGQDPVADKGIQDLKTRYLKIRNTDLEIRDPVVWETLASDFQSFVEAYPKHFHSPAALQNAAILYEEIFKKHGGQERLDKSAALLERIPRDYPGHTLSDDALMKRGNMLLDAFDDLAGAQKCFREIVDSYPDADMHDAAQARLAQLKSESAGSRRKREELLAAKEVSPVQRPAGVPLIVIDPGHGGEDYGAPGKSGLLEKDVVLAVAFELEKLLRDEAKVAVKLTRRRDEFVPLAARTALANDNEATLFVSIHANASPEGKLSGVETFYLDNSGDQASLRLAEMENKSLEFEGPQSDLQFMLSDLIQGAKVDDSARLGRLIQGGLLGTLKSRWEPGKSYGVRKAPFYVLVGAHMPCVLVEIGFIDNPRDGANLAEKEFRADAARGIFTGLRQFLNAAS